MLEDLALAVKQIAQCNWSGSCLSFPVITPLRIHSLGTPRQIALKFAILKPPLCPPAKRKKETYNTAVESLARRTVFILTLTADVAHYQNSF